MTTLGKTHRITSLKLREISAVTRPAQAGALATILKRDFSAEEREALAESGAAMPDGSFPIATKADLANAIQAHGRASDPAKVKAHIIARAKALGATDELPDGWVSKSAGDPGDHQPKGASAMSTETEKKLADLEKVAADAKAQIEKLTAEKVVAEALAKMSDGEKAYMNGLDDTAKGKFLAMSSDERKSAMTKAAADDEVLKVGETTVRKSAVGETAFAVMKAQQAVADQQAAEIAKLRDRDETARFEKMARETYPSLPGTEAERGAVVKAIESIKDEAVRKHAHAMLKVGEDAAKGAFRGLGRAGTGVAKSGEVSPVSKAEAEDKLEKLAKERSADGKVTFAKAYAEVLEEHPELYAMTIDQQSLQ